MEAFTDADGNTLSHVALVLAPAQASAVVVARVPCEAGRYLAASAGAASRVEARRTGSGDPFVDLAVAPISLTPYAGGLVSFDFRVTALSPSARVRDALEVRATFNP